DVMLVVNNNGCEDSLLKTDFVTIQPPKAAMTVKRNCNDRYTVTFSDRSTGAISWHWDFGDGTSSDVQNPPAHHYSQKGAYKVTLTVKSSTCAATTEKNILIIDEDPSLQLSTDTV